MTTMPNLLILFCAALFTTAQLQARFLEDDIRALQQQARDNGWARVIVGLDAPFRAEGGLLPLARQQQRRAIETAQSGVLRGLSKADATLKARFSTIPFMTLQVNERALNELARNPRITSINADLELSPTLLESNAIIGSASAWSASYLGSGFAVAIIGTGVDKTHPWLDNGKVVAEACFSTTVAGAYSSLCPGDTETEIGEGTGQPFPSNVSGSYDHETHVAGIAAGAGVPPEQCDDNETHLGVCGVAPGANLIAIQIYTEKDSGGITGLTSDMVKALEHVYLLSDTHPIASVNLSLGGGRYYEHCDLYSLSTAAAVANLRSVEIATVATSGNNSYRGSMIFPGCLSEVISVGGGNDNDTLYSPTNLSNFLSLLAPGSLITSSVPNAGTATKSGTSMAAPHVAGAWAALRQAASISGVSPDIDNLLDALRATATRIDFNADYPNLKRINVDLAANHLVGGIPRADNVAIDGVFLPGETLFGNYDFFDGDGDPESGSGYRWQQGDNATGVNAIDIADGNTREHLTTERDMSGYLRFCVTPSDGVNNGDERCSLWRRAARDIYVDDSATGANDGTDWTNAFVHLQDALATVEANMGDTIHIAQGVYYPDLGSDQTDDYRYSTFWLPDATTLLGGYPDGGGVRAWRSYPTILSGDLQQNDNQRPLVTDPSTLTGQADNAYHVVTASHLEKGSFLEGLYITAGYADYTYSPYNDGAGIFIEDARLNLTQIEVSGNTADDNGGGIYNGIGRLEIDDGRILANLARGNGGGIYNTRAQTTATNTLISGNQAHHGGGIGNYVSSPTLYQCIISGNLANAYGGAIYNITESAPRLRQSTLTGNYAKEYGGAFLSFYDSPTSIENTILWNNDAVLGNPNAFSDDTSTPSYSHSLVEGSGGSNSWNGDFGIDNGGNLDADPLFSGPITADNATETGGDFHLPKASPAIDAGDHQSALLAYDLDGLPRTSPSNGRIDIGVYELPQIAITISPQPTHGNVTSLNGEIHCGTTKNACQAAYPLGARAELTATPTSGQLFTGWGGDCSDNLNSFTQANPLTLDNLQADLTCSISFCDANDCDGDGLTDDEENQLGTDPGIYDTDGDGLSDGEETTVTGTDPLDPDSDGDGLLDGTDEAPLTKAVDQCTAAEAVLSGNYYGTEHQISCRAETKVTITDFACGDGAAIGVIAPLIVIGATHVEGGCNSYWTTRN